MLHCNKKRSHISAGSANYVHHSAPKPKWCLIELGIFMLKGKSALVTGSTSGIGLCYARALAAEGANITINGFGDAAAIEKERSGIEKDFGVKAVYSAADMSKPAEIADMIKTAEQTFGALDILINNAGIQYVAPIEEFPIEKWDQIIAINLSSAFHAMRAAVPGMKARKWGRIIRHGVGAFAGRLTIQVCLCDRQARPRRAHQDGRARDRDLRHHRATASAPAMSGRRWSRSKFPIRRKRVA